MKRHGLRVRRMEFAVIFRSFNHGVSQKTFCFPFPKKMRIYITKKRKRNTCPCSISFKIEQVYRATLSQWDRNGIGHRRNVSLVETDDWSMGVSILDRYIASTHFAGAGDSNWVSCHKRQKPQAPIRNRQTRKVANAKGLNRNTNLT